MATLPAELLERVLELSLPPTPPILREITSTAVSRRPLACWTNWKERSTTLRTLSLVCRRWRDWAQRELWRHVVLETESDVRSLLEAGNAIGAEERRRRGFTTETVRIGGAENGGPMSGRDFGAVLRLLQADEVEEGAGIKELWLVTMRGVDLRELRHLNDLRTLFCNEITLSVPAGSPQTPVRRPPLRLSRLRSLTLQLVKIDPSLRTIMFEDHRFPSLEILEFDNFEVLTQLFDGNPDAIPKLKAIKPGTDTQAEYFAALQKEDDVYGSNALSEDYPLDLPVRPYSLDDPLPPPPSAAPDDPLPQPPHQAPAPLPAPPFPPGYGFPPPLPAVLQSVVNVPPAFPPGYTAPDPVDGLLTMWMSDDFLKYLPYFAPSLPNDLVKLTLNFSIGDIEHEHFDEFLRNEDFLRILALKRSTPRRPTGVTHIHATDPSFLVDLAQRWPNSVIDLAMLLAEREIAFTRGHSYGEDEYEGIGPNSVEARLNLDFWLDAERVIWMHKERRGRRADWESSVAE